MVFSSLPFLYYFLPAALLLYALAPRGRKNAALLLASLVFYGWGEPKFLIWMVLAILQGYVSGLLIERADGTRRRTYLAISVTLSMGMLFCCKYADFFIGNVNAITGASLPLTGIALPVGISFYTFQIVSYAVDVYRGEAPAQRRLVDLAAYIAMFPQLIAGPIVRYADIAPQLQEREHSWEKCAAGVRRFIWGLGKKVLIANSLGELCAAFKASGDRSLLFFWLYAVGYALHIYFDFSGYSDMAIGLGKLFGFEFRENFRYPYVSGSITEFWRRWHISLGSWFRDYVYIPLGGNRVSKPRWFFNILVVWLCTGFWHGAAWNFVVWGLFFGLLLMVEKLWLGKHLKGHSVLSHLYVLLAVVISFVIFDAASLSEAGHSIAALFGLGGYPLFSAEAVYYLKSYALLLLAAAVGATPAMARLCGRIGGNERGRRALNALEPAAELLLLLAATGYMVDGSFNPFLYFRF
ncbi:MAG: MBOAT family O-acyltransferase [Oscillospiraceae bacterium]|nr:MBOAT family O-acyltransferase [Oscillospiraceae bacterium]